MADKERELTAQKAQIQQEIKEKGKSLVAEEIASLKREHEATEKMLAGKQRTLDARIEAAEDEWKEAQKARKERRKELFPFSSKAVGITVIVFFVVFAHWIMPAYQLHTAEENSQVEIRKNTEKTWFGKLKTVPVHSGYVQELVNAVYEQRPMSQDAWSSLCKQVNKINPYAQPAKETEQKEQQKPKGDRTQAKQQSKQEQAKKQDKQQKAVAKPKPATAKDIKTIEAVQQSEQKNKPLTAQEFNELKETIKYRNTLYDAQMSPEEKAQEMATIESVKNKQREGQETSY